MYQGRGLCLDDEEWTGIFEAVRLIMKAAVTVVCLSVHQAQGPGLRRLPVILLVHT